MRKLGWLALLLALGCGSDDPKDALDAGAPDGSTPDARVETYDARVVNVDASMDAHVSDAGVQPVQGAQWVLGYYAGYQIDRYPVAEIDWTTLTHIALAGISVNADGSFDTRFYNFDSNAPGEAFAKQLSSAARAHGVKALLMLGGAGASDGVKPQLANTAAFVQRLLAKMDELGYDGIDLDVEAENFSLDDFITLASALRAARPSVLLSVPGATVQFGQTVDARLVTLAQSLDRYNIQSYQGGSAGLFTGGNSNGGVFESWFYGALGGASALRPYTIDHALAQLAAAGIPKAKLGMGVAFYAACYKIPDTTPQRGQDVSAPRMGTGATTDWCWDCGVGGGDNKASYDLFYASDGLLGRSRENERKRDEVAQEPYLTFAKQKYDDLCGGNTRYVIYEDEISLEAKGAFSRSNGYGGVILWTIQQGRLPEKAAGGRQRDALFHAVRKGFLGR